MADAKYTADGRRFYSWAEVDEMPDRNLPCPVCGQSWERHEGTVELAVLDGHVGYTLPRCPSASP